MYLHLCRCVFLLITEADAMEKNIKYHDQPSRSLVTQRITFLFCFNPSPFSSLTATTIEKFPGSEQMTCNILWSDPKVGTLGGSTFILYSLILGFAIPLSLILVFYYLVIKKLQTVGPKNKSKDKKRSHRKVTRLVLTVITVYVLCWTPYWVIMQSEMKIY